MSEQWKKPRELLVAIAKKDRAEIALTLLAM
jgi:hypothetical protein